MTVQILEVNTEQLKQACFAIRREVFIDEQSVPEELELDAYDDDSLFLVALHDGEPVGTCRLRQLANNIKLERVAVLKSARGLGIGKQLTLAAMKLMQERFEDLEPKMDAQEQVVPFYQSLGWEVVSDKFLDAGIWHYTMKRKQKAIS